MFIYVVLSHYPFLFSERLLMEREITAQIKVPVRNFLFTRDLKPPHIISNIHIKFYEVSHTH